MSFIILFVLAVFIFVKLKKKPSITGPVTLSVPNGQIFHATHSSRDLAIDANSKNLWCRDEKGSVYVFTREQVTGWTHTWTNMHKGVKIHNINNAMEIRVKSLDYPLIRVSFKTRNLETIKSAKKDYIEASEWQQRLTALYNLDAT